MSATDPEAPVDGTCRDDVSLVRDAFAENFASRGEVGAAVCVMIDGEVVVDLVGGWTDESHATPWTPDTLVNVYSVGKAIVSMLALELVDTGAVGLDDTLESFWPAFGVGGKAAATVRHALSHQAGVPAIRERLTNDDLWHWQTMVDALAATEAWFEPGSRVAYHTNTFGHLVGEIVRAVSGAMPGERLARHGVDVWCGVPEAEQARCADVIWASPSDLGAIDPFALEGDTRMVMLGYANPPGYSSNAVVNTAQWRSAQVPSTNMHASARGVAAFYDRILRGDVISPDLLAEATRVQSSGPCPVLGEEVTFGLGVVPTTARRPLGSSPRAFGHFGTGGALGFADPDRGLAFGYVMNHVIPRWQSTRNRSLIDALYP